MTRAVLRKELAALWASPIPYAIGAALHVVLGALVVDQLEGRDQAVLQPLFPIAGLLLVLAVPALTMRTFAEEERSGSLDLLLAAGVPPRPLVLGKWAAVWCTTIAVLAPAALHLALVVMWGTPDLGPAASGFLGLVLLAAGIAAVGVLVSAATASQTVAVLLAAMVVLLLWFADAGSDGLSAGASLASVSLSERLRGFAGGVVAVADVGFFVGLTVAGLAAACAVVDLRRLR